MKINLDKINKKISKGNWIILYYSDSCVYCKEFMPIWKKFIKTKITNLNKLKIKSEYFNFIDINPGIEGVPTIHFYTNGKLYKRGIFKKKRTLEELIHFCKKNIIYKKKKTIKKLRRNF